MCLPQVVDTNSPQPQDVTNACLYYDLLNWNSQFSKYSGEFE
jgi:hypothetical protein